jgi:DNA-binding CsgD family transcriptional regulator
MGLVKMTAEILATIEGEEPDHALTLAPNPFGLTDRQREVLDAIERLSRRYGQTPTDAELGAALGIGPRGLRDHRLSLFEKGAIGLASHGRRRIRLRAEIVGGFNVVPAAPHGLTGYRHFDCRCETCRAAQQQALVDLGARSVWHDR